MKPIKIIGIVALSLLVFFFSGKMLLILPRIIFLGASAGTYKLGFLLGAILGYLFVIFLCTWGFRELLKRLR
ncbi:MAG: hypothetical protein NTX50_29660 [Candidatus Sumerlaeota bacterium]|nr:hypothetical protein [Candidatus Sumerlaeota bacterium]